MRTGVTSKIAKSARRLTKGALLILWIIMLAAVAGFAASERASEAVIDYFKPYTPTYYLGRGAEFSPSLHLANYLRTYDSNPPPLEALLDRVIIGSTWSEQDIAQHFREPNEGETPEDYSAARSRWMAEQYNSLFRRVDRVLQALVSDAALNPDRASLIRPDLPSVFEPDSAQAAQRSSVTKEIELPLEVAIWVKEQRIRSLQSEERKSLIDTFFLLMVLGAFGSLIFLSKDYIEREEETSLAAYIFRPILGMFLAVAVFIVDVAAHSIISTASILQTRHETLFLLALAAGILSEQAYDVVTVRAKNALDELRRKGESPTERSEESNIDREDQRNEST